MTWVLENPPTLLTAELAFLLWRSQRKTPHRGPGQAPVPARQPLGLLEEWRESHMRTQNDPGSKMGLPPHGQMV